MIHSYSKIFRVDHAACAALADVSVQIEEKVDGSQISFSVDRDGVLSARSRGVDITVESPDRMFATGIAELKSIQHLLTPGFVYRGEYLSGPKHNTLKYSRVPKHNIVIFDIERSCQNYVGPVERRALAADADLECVPVFYSGPLPSIEVLAEFLERESMLGGSKVEGVVIKPSAYNLFGEDKKLLIGKFVRPEFQEMNQGEWKKSNPKASDIIDLLSKQLRNEARWAKAMHALRDRGELSLAPADLARLIPYVKDDLRAEEYADTASKLAKWAWPQIERRAIYGLPEWYKARLSEIGAASEEEVVFHDKEEQG